MSSRPTLRDAGSHYIDRPITRVNATDEYMKAAYREAEAFTTIDEHTVVETEDGWPLLYVIKRGMLYPWGVVAEEAAKISFTAIERLVTSYTPPHSSKDPRHRRLADRELARWGKLGHKWGILHLACWRDQNDERGPIHANKESKPNSEAARREVDSYVYESRWEHILCSKWLKVLDEPTWTKYWTSYQKLRQEGTLEHLDQGDMACFSGQALLINAAVDAHKDYRDPKTGWVPTYCWGDFEGAEAVFPGLSAIVKQEAGDLLFSRSAVLEHWIKEIKSGQRFGNARFTKRNVLEPTTERYFCPVPGCDKVDGYATQAALHQHKTRKHPGERAKRNRERKSQIKAAQKSGKMGKTK